MVTETFSDPQDNALAILRQHEMLKGKFKVGQCVTVLYDKQEYPGVVTEVNQEGAMVDCMEKGKFYYKWPEQKYEILYPWGGFDMTFIQSSLHVVTPLIKSPSMSQILPGNDVYLKMESGQVSGSFKMRGIGCRCQKSIQRGSKRLVGASGGNAGLALARSAKLLQVPCTVFVPITTAQVIIERLRSDGADVVVHGANFSIANERALKEAEKPDVSFVHAYNHPEIWEGNSSVIREMAIQLPSKPSVIVTAVGGGGLLSGVLLGLKEAGWSDVPVVAMETEGAHCFNLSVQANKVVPLENITSIATTLGARTIPHELMAMLPEFKVISEVVTDSDAVNSCLQFADAEKTIVEPSCGAALAAIYCGVLTQLECEGRLALTNHGPVALIVCGGSGVSLGLLQQWAVKFDIAHAGQNDSNLNKDIHRDTWTKMEKCM